MKQWREKEMNFIGCKHLDYEDHYDDCKIRLIETDGVRCWQRGKKWTKGGNPENVQFCKLRGRINSIYQCINPGEMVCYEAQEEEK